MKNHNGICVGSGVCVESSSIWEEEIQCTFMKGSGYSNTRKLKERTWIKHGLFDKYIDYDIVEPQPTPNTGYYMKYTGSSTQLDEVLLAVGVSTSYCGHWTKRVPLALKNTINNYTGTASQNIKLIQLAKQGKLKKI